MRFMQTESVLQTKNRSGPAKNRFSVALRSPQYDVQNRQGTSFYQQRQTPIITSEKDEAES